MADAMPQIAKNYSCISDPIEKRATGHAVMGHRCHGCSKSSMYSYSRMARNSPPLADMVPMCEFSVRSEGGKHPASSSSNTETASPKAANHIVSQIALELLQIASVGATERTKCWDSPY